MASRQKRRVMANFEVRLGNDAYRLLRQDRGEIRAWESFRRECIGRKGVPQSGSIRGNCGVNVFP